MINWQTMDNAPRDGTEILVLLEMASVWVIHIARYVRAEEWSDNPTPEDEGWWSYVDNSVAQELLDGYRTPVLWAPWQEPREAR